MAIQQTTVLTYTSDEQLRDLVATLTESSIELEAHLEARVPEEFRKLRHDIVREDYGNQYHPEKLAELKPWIVKLVEEAKRLRVMPFTTLLYELQYGISSPRVEIKGLASRMDDVINQLCSEVSDPLRIIEGWRYFAIKMDEAQKPNRIKMVKDTILGLPLDEYSIGYIHAKLNPRVVTRDHYYDVQEYDATLYAGGGKITITGCHVETSLAATSGKPSSSIVERLTQMGFQLALPAPEKV